MNLTPNSKEILRIASPAIISNVTVPLLGMVDVAIAGHMGASYIGAIAVGGLVFSIICWIFGFLRASTSGLTAQALGENCKEKIKAYYWRSVFFALAISAFLLAIQMPLGKIIFHFIGADSDTTGLVMTYYSICIWGIPAVMLTQALNGWFIGMQNTRIPMTIAIVQNIINIPVSLVLVYGLAMKIEGIAIGTVTAQYVGLFIALILRRKNYGTYCGYPTKTSVMEWAEVGHFMYINRDIFLRTLCMVAVTTFFTTASARQGELILAANTLLLQLFYFFSYVMDGFANAGEAIAGCHYGAKEYAALSSAVRTLFRWGVAITLCFTLVYCVGGIPFLSLLTDSKEVLGIAPLYYWWVILIPSAGFAAFLWDGIFIGMTMTFGMLLSASIATISFFICWYTTDISLGNHALWLAFIIYLSMRGLIQTIIYARSIKTLLCSNTGNKKEAK